MGEGHYQALREQAQYSDQDLQQVCQVFLRAWRHVVLLATPSPPLLKQCKAPMSHILIF